MSAAVRIVRDIIALDRREIEAIIEALIGAIDEADGDPDAEDDTMDCCAACDDDPAGIFDNCIAGYDGLPGTPEDAEDLYIMQPMPQCDPPVAFIRREHMSAAEVLIWGGPRHGEPVRLLSAN